MSNNNRKSNTNRNNIIQTQISVRNINKSNNSSNSNVRGTQSDNNTKRKNNKSNNSSSPINNNKSNNSSSSRKYARKILNNIEGGDLLNRNDFDRAINRMINGDIISTRTAILIGLERMKRNKAKEKKNLTRYEKEQKYKELLEKLPRNIAKVTLENLYSYHRINYIMYLNFKKMLESPVKRKHRNKSNNSSTSRKNNKKK